MLNETKFMAAIEYLRNDSSFTADIEYRINNNITISSPIYNYCQALFSRILFRCAKLEKLDRAIEIQKRYFSSITMLSVYDYESKNAKLEQAIHSTLCLDRKYMLFNKEDILKLSEYKISEYKNMLNSWLKKYNKEMLIQYLYMSASIISYISMNSFYIYKYKEQDSNDVSKTFLNLIIDTIGVIFDSDYIYLNDIFAKEKKAFEYLIHYILNTEIDYLEYSNEIDIQQLIEISSLIVSEVIIKETSRKIYKMKHHFELVEGKISPDSEFIEKQEKYFNKSLKYQYKINNKEVENIIDLFQNVEKYSPLIYEKYVTNKNKFLKEDVISNFVEDEFLKLDIKKSIGLANADIQKLLDSLSLKSYNNIERDIFKDENRLFLTPLINIGKHYLVSYNLMIESAHYFRKRILKENLSKNRRVKQKIESKYDEIELEELSNLMTTCGIINGTNKSLEVNDKLKALFCEKGVTKEVDLYFIKSGVLNVVEYKNHELARNMYEVVKHCDKSEDDVKKCLRMVAKIDENRELFFDVFGDKFHSIKTFFIFKNPNPYIQFCTRKDIVPMEYDDFYNMCLKGNI
jgi:hypothetical protein